jgi:hypothetical protein
MLRRLLLFIAGSVLSFTGVVSGQVPAGTSWIRVVHAVSDAPAVDVAANGNLVFQGLKFKDFSEYAPVPSGAYTVEVKLSGTNTTVITSGPLTVQGRNAYTFYALGRVAASNLFLMGTGDDVVAPAAGSTKLRVVHGASTAPAVDVYASAPFAPLPSNAAITSFPFALGSPYLSVQAGVYQARVTVAGTTNVVIDSGRLPLTAGAVRTVVALDPTTPGGAFQLLVLPDVN